MTTITQVRDHRDGKAIHHESLYRGYSLIHFKCGDIAIFAPQGEHLETETSMDGVRHTIDGWLNAR